MPTRGTGFLRPAVVAGTVSGAPSTAFNLVTGRPLLEAATAAGNTVLPVGSETPALLAAGVLAHAVLSLGWAAVLAPRLRRARRPVLAGAACGLVIAALDLGVVAHGLARRRMTLVRTLPVGPQIADHVAFGAVL